jgi:hypothetical protein
MVGMIQMKDSNGQIASVFELRGCGGFWCVFAASEETVRHRCGQ